MNGHDRWVVAGYVLGFALLIVLVIALNVAYYSWLRS